MKHNSHLLFPGDHKTFLHRQLKRRAMNNYFDLRGSRRLSLLCDFVHKVLIMITMIAMVMAITRTLAVMGTIEITNMIVF